MPTPPTNWRDLFFGHLDGGLALPPSPPLFPCRGIAGVVPLGYVQSRAADGWSIRTDPAAAAHVREAYRLAAAPGALPREAWRLAARRGLVSASGQPMSYPAFRLLLLNPFYLGLVRHRGELYRGPQEPLVGLGTWALARHNLLGSEERWREQARSRAERRAAKFPDSREDRR